MRSLARIKFITIRCIFAIGVTMDWEIHQIDIKEAFLMGSWRNILCANSRKHYMGSNNYQGRGTTKSTHSSLTKAFLGVKWTIHCTLNNQVRSCWW